MSFITLTCVNTGSPVYLRTSEVAAIHPVVAYHAGNAKYFARDGARILVSGEWLQVRESVETVRAIVEISGKETVK
jgi:hypothetical protein